MLDWFSSILVLELLLEARPYQIDLEKVRKNQDAVVLGCNYASILILSGDEYKTSLKAFR